HGRREPRARPAGAWDARRGRAAGEGEAAPHGERRRPERGSEAAAEGEEAPRHGRAQREKAAAAEARPGAAGPGLAGAKVGPRVPVAAWRDARGRTASSP